VTDLNVVVGQLIDDQQDLIIALRAMIGRGADARDLADVVRQIEATDAQIQSLTAVLRKFAELPELKKHLNAQPGVPVVDE